MKLCISFFLLSPVFIFSYSVSAQTYIQYADKTFGGNAHDNFESMIYFGNNQILLAGHSSTSIDGDKIDPLCDTSGMFLQDLWFLKIDTAFNIILQNDIGGDYNDIEPRICKTFDSNRWVIVCTSRSDSACDKTENNRSAFNQTGDFWALMIDSSGNKIWDKTFGGSSPEGAARIIQLTTGDYIVSGTSTSVADGDKTVANYGGSDYWVIKLDSAGNKLWDKVYGGTGVESAATTSSVFCALSCAQGDFILAGETSSPAGNDITDTSRGGYDVWMIKADSAGNRIWDRRYGGSGIDYCAHIISTDDNGYILCGGTNSPQDGDISDFSRGLFDCWVIKLDSLGNKQWDKRYGGTNSEHACWIEAAPGGGYWVGANTGSDSSFEVSENGYGGSDCWVFKIDNFGNKLWDKRYGTIGGDQFHSLIILPDSSVLLGGYADTGISPVKTDSGKGGLDYWVVHFKYTDGYVSTSENQAAVTNFTIYPNPATDKLQLDFGHRRPAEDATTGNPQKSIIRIINLIGEEVLQTKTEAANTTIDIKYLTPGMYFVTMQMENGIVTKKFVKE